MVPELSLPAVRRATHDDVGRHGGATGEDVLARPGDAATSSTRTEGASGRGPRVRTSAPRCAGTISPSAAATPTDGYAGSAIWAPVGKPLLTGLTAVLTMLPVFRYVAAKLPRTLRLLNMVESMHPHEPHWYLATLGTAVDQQGKGVGRRIAAPRPLPLRRGRDPRLPRVLQGAQRPLLPPPRLRGRRGGDPARLRSTACGPCGASPAPSPASRPSA